jgi:hypothetical protein
MSNESVSAALSVLSVKFILDMKLRKAVIAKEMSNNEKFITHLCLIVSNDLSGDILSHNRNTANNSQIISVPSNT